MKKSDLRENITIKIPKIDKSVFVAEGARLIGDIILKPYCSVWYNTVARADINQIIIGERSNIQDNSVIHLENDQGVIIGDDVTIGHNSIIHGCTIHDGALVGMGSIIMNGALIGKGAVIGAGAVVTENMQIPDFGLVVGVPGKIKKILSEDTYDVNVKWAKKYVQLAAIHQKKANETKS